MRTPNYRLAGLALVSVLAGGPALAQDQASATYGNTTVSIGGGTAILDLPDQQFIKIIPTFAIPGTVSGRFTTADDFSREIGWNVNGTITAPLGAHRWITASGFWAQIDDKDNTTCTDSAGAACVVNALVSDPALLSFAGAVLVGESLFTTSEREVDQAGLSVEVKQLLAPGVSRQAHDAAYFGLGVDWRAIYQDTTLDMTRSVNTAFDLNYSEELNTNYYGIFAAYGGDYTPLLLSGFWNRLGLQSSFRVQGGIYYADTDYSGSLREASSPVVLNSDATDSSDDFAFIGRLTTETRKQLSARATLSLKSEFEYYSFVPSINYNDNINGGALSGPNVGTTIDDEDAYAARTSLSLTIKLGPESLFRNE
ncbi:MAG: hypothetical protein AAFO75_06420 [Pseudomonadota bacterium]